MNQDNNTAPRADEVLRRLAELERENGALRAQLQSQQMESRKAAASASSHLADTVDSANLRIRSLKHTHSALQASEGWLRALLESTTDYAIITLDLTGRVTSWNSGARNILGWDEAEVIGSFTEFFFTPEDREADQPNEEMSKALTQGRAQDERWHLRRDGSRFWGHGVLMPFQDSELLGFVKILRDRTQEREADQRLRENEEQLREIMESISDAFYALDSEMRFIYVNHHAAESWGRKVEDLVGRVFTEAFPEVVGTRQWNLHEMVRIAREPCQVEMPSAITQRWLSVSFYPGAQGGLTVYFRDITDRKRTENAITEGRRRLFEILESISDAFYAVDQHWRFTYINRKAEQLWGRKREELIGQVYPEVFPQVIGSTSFNAHVKAMEERQPVHFEAVSPILSYWVDINIYPTADGGLSVYFRDITERKTAEEHQRVLIHELNHRVKNTLATVQSIASQTLRNADTTAVAQKALESRLFALSRAHDVLTRENWEAASLHEIVAQAMQPYLSHGEKRIQFAGPTLRIPPRMALALAMAFQELATNAVKYGALANETGQIGIRWVVETRDDRRRLMIRWEESGGAPVSRPERRGFGSRLIERSLAHDLDGNATITFDPDGVICLIEAPLP